MKKGYFSKKLYNSIFLRAVFSNAGVNQVVFMLGKGCVEVLLVRLSATVAREIYFLAVLRHNTWRWKHQLLYSPGP